MTAHHHYPIKREGEKKVAENMLTTLSSYSGVGFIKRLNETDMSVFLKMFLFFNRHVIIHFYELYILKILNLM